MYRVRRSATLLLLAAVVASQMIATTGSAAPLGAPPERPLPPHAPGEALVAFESGTSPAERAAAFRGIGATSSEPLSPLAPDVEVVRFPTGLAVAQVVADLSRNPNVRLAEPNYILTTTATSDDTQYVAGAMWGMYGDSANPDTQYGSQADQAWAGGATGSRDVYVGILDTGILWTHPDLAANVGNRNEIRGNNRDDDGNGKVDDTYGWDFTSTPGNASPKDGNGHGTHVAGTIGAVGGNGIGVAGVSWNVGLLSGRFMGKAGKGTTADAIRALDYFTDLKQRGLNIVATNNSWGGGPEDTLLLDAIRRGGDAGILFVVAAGNASTDNDVLPTYPANYDCSKKADGTSRPGGWDCVLSVASINVLGSRSGFSNFGATTVDIGAPGSGIMSTSYSGGYVSMGGTSMATPHVSGAVALCASLGPSLTAAQLRASVMSSARATPDLTGKVVSGGRLDVGALVGTCSGGATTAGRTPTRSLTVNLSGTGRLSLAPLTGCAWPTTTCTESRTGTMVLVPTLTGSRLTSWSGCSVVSGTTCVVYMNQARTVTASSSLNSYRVAVALAKPSGTYPYLISSHSSSWKCSGSCAFSALYGTTITFTAVFATGVTRVAWTGCDSTTATTCTVSVDAAESVLATFSA